VGIRPGRPRGLARALHRERGGGTRAAPPDDLDEYSRFGACALEFETIGLFPSYQSVVEHQRLEFVDDGEEERYLDWLAGLGMAAEAQDSWLLGWPDEIQGDVQIECAQVAGGDPEDWRLLLQVNSVEDAGMMWGDAGMLYFMIRADDLAARRFDRVWLTLQCY